MLDGRLRVMVELTERALTARPRSSSSSCAGCAGAASGSPSTTWASTTARSRSCRSSPGRDQAGHEPHPPPSRRRPARVVHAVQAEAERTGATWWPRASRPTSTSGARSRSAPASARAGCSAGPEPLPTHARALPRRGYRSPATSSIRRASPFTVVAAERSTIVGDKPLLLSFSRQLEARARASTARSWCWPPSRTSASSPSSPRSATASWRSEPCSWRVRRRDVREPMPGVRGVSIEESEALRGEWNVIVLSPHFSAAFVGSDLGDEGPDSRAGSSSRYARPRARDRGGADAPAQDRARYLSASAQRKPAKIWRRCGRSQLRKVSRATAGRVAHEAPRSTR